MTNSWIKNMGKRPEGLYDREKVQVHWSDGTTETYNAEFVCWDIIDDGTYCTHWRKVSEQTLETAYDTPPKEDEQFVIKPTQQVQPSIASKIATAMGSLYDVEVTENTVLKIVALHNIFK